MDDLLYLLRIVHRIRDAVEFDRRIYGPGSVMAFQFGKT